MTLPHVTVAVPVKDRRERMLRCLDALLALDYPSYEVLILDNELDGRHRPRPAESARRMPDVAGAGGGRWPARVGHLRNRAAEMATGELVAFTDSDCAPTPGWLAAAVAALRRPGVGLVQGRTAPEPGVEMRALGGHHRGSVLFGSLRELQPARPPRGLRRGRRLRRGDRAFRGGHRGGRRRWCGRGWRCAFVPEALVYHDVTHPGIRWWMKRGLAVRERRAGWWRATRSCGRRPALGTGLPAPAQREVRCRAPRDSLLGPARPLGAGPGAAVPRGSGRPPQAPPASRWPSGCGSRSCSTPRYSRAW